ncbi:ABC transporter substrate-binding protein [Agromyces aerolatus]|uniref:ABC transporter substrate-binding protein n=1 Tax=Agromyces sp. LY-1074 TaxID=3074080 RepID=UPI0028545625|nr:MULTISPECIES: ABC transporter substrate-binding protein [unclassified Agromyces]MDR5699436.1 ABC transporter substrate-binding protein [Agromyces sp. LY-1074]MDR5705732.1 ABC transporter substrate-binding protein [Agromyces sp. LY-1358]
MVSKIWGPALALTAAAALALTGCAAGDPAEGGDSGDDGGGTFTIYASLSLTGPLAGSSKAQQEGLEIAVDRINAEGGINGEQIELIIADDQLDPTKAVTLLQEQLDEAKPDMVVHGVSSAVSLAMLPLLTRNEVLSISNTYANEINDPATFPYAFGTNPVVALDPEAAVELFTEEGYEKVAYLGANDALGQSIAEAFSEVFAAEGLELVQESYAPADLDMTAQLQRLQATDPDTLIIQGYGTAAGYALESRTKLGWDIVTYGDGGLGNGNNLALISGEEDWNNLYLRVFPINTPQREVEGTEAFAYLTGELEKRGSSFDQLMQLYALQWDAVHVVKQAVEQADAKDAPSVADALVNLEPYEGETPYITHPEFRSYTTDNHFRNLSTDAYIVVRPGPVVEGTIESIE